jgi:pimeloyl-ACP methyl ester carboxylesterase
MNRPPLCRWLLPLTLLLTVPLARADVLVLVHGWSANADTWWHSGVMPALQANGWRDAGVLHITPTGVGHFRTASELGERTVYRAQLPAEAPLTVQAGHLHTLLGVVARQHPDEPLAVAGHSAGGVVARMMLVGQHPAVRIDTLVSIAAPQRGTVRAIQGLQAADSKPVFCPGPGVDFLKSMFGGSGYDYLRYSRGALLDMTPDAPGTLTHWLNTQPHADSRYHSVVHSDDELVPPPSQDLNQVPALRGRVQVHSLPAPHALGPADGQLLARLLDAS